MLWSTSFVHCKCTTVYWCRLTRSKTVCSYKYSISSAATNREWKCAKNYNKWHDKFISLTFNQHFGNYKPYQFPSAVFDKIASIYFICVPPKIHLLFFNNCQKLPDCNDFWHVKSWENLTTKILHIVPSPVRCSHCTVGNPKKSFSTVLFIHISDYIRYVTRKQSVIHLPTPPENVATLTCELQNFLIRLKVCCVLSNVGRSEESQLWVVFGCSEKNRLWCVATGMSGKQCHSKCSEWPPSALIHVSSVFDTVQSRSTPCCAEIQPLSQQAAAASLNTSISIHALL